jgi:hypothetical protein
MLAKFIKITLVLSIILYTVFMLLTPITFSLSVFAILVLISAFTTAIIFFILGMFQTQN